MNAVTKIKSDGSVPIGADTSTFAEAFIKLQSAIKPAIKDAENAAFSRGNKVSRYADLAAVWEAVKDPLKDNGFAVIQMPQFEGETMYLETILLHVGGDKMTGRYPLKPAKLDPQGFGSAITYARRYALSAMLGVIADDDDDGNAASGISTGKATTPPGKITATQVAVMRDLIEKTGTNIEAFCAHFKIEALPDLPVAKHATAIEMLNVKAARK